MKDALVAGVVGRPHGLDGSFHVQEGRAELLEQGMRLTVAGVEVEIVRRAGTDDRPIVRLAGHEGRDAAEALRGERLLAERAEAPPLAPGEFYTEDLVGCRVHAGEREVGIVTGVMALPSCEALEVERRGEPVLLVPLVRDAVSAVDIDSRRIEIDLRFLGEA